MCAPATSSAKETLLGFFDDAEAKLCPSRDGAASGSRVAAWVKLSWLEEAPGVTALSYYYHYLYDHYCHYYHSHSYYYGAKSRGHHVDHVARLTSPWPGASAALVRQLVL